MSDHNDHKFRTLLTILVLAIIYYLSGNLGLLLAIPPGFATALWPASGFALAGVLLAGPRVLPGVFLGSFIVNFQNWDWVFTPLAIGSTSVTALGAALQTWIGYILIKRYVGDCCKLEDESDVLKFFLIAGPISCLVNPIVSVSALFAAGIVALTEVPINLFTWWVGDAIGAMIFAPVTVYFFNNRNEIRSAIASVLLPLGITFLLVVGIFMAANQYERQFLHQEQQSKMSILSNAFIQDLRSLSNFPLDMNFYIFTHKNLSNKTIKDLFTYVMRNNSTIVGFYKYDVARHGGFEESTSAIRDESLKENGRAFVETILATIRLDQRAMQPVILRQGYREFAHLFAIITPLDIGGFVIELVDSRKVLAGLPSVEGIVVRDFNLETSDSFEEIRIIEELTSDQNRRGESKLRLEKNFVLAGFQMNLKLWGEDTLPRSRSWLAWGILAMGLLFTSMLSATLFIVQTRNKRIERVVEERTAELKSAQELVVNNAKLSALGEMAAHIAHEVNSPITIMTINAQRIEGVADQMPEGIKQRVVKSAQSIVQTGNTISRIVNSMLTLARDGSRDPYVLIAAEDLINMSLDLCRERFKINKIDLKVEAGEDCLVWCRPAQLAQVLLNLLNNAFDAVIDAQERWVNVSLLDKGSYYELAVVDSGGGVPANIRKTMMHPFVTTKPMGKGTGLGLSISASLVKAHGGELFLDEKSRHTRFVVRLPKSIGGKA